MSAIARTDIPGGLTGLRMDAKRYLSLGETNERYELVNGVVLMSPSASYPHNQTAAEIMFQLLRFADAGGDVVAVHETDIRFSEVDVYRPDVAAFRASRLKGRPETLNVVPDLAVEVLSEARKPYDLITKRNDYERFGVREYWVVDPSSGTVRCWRRRGRKLAEVKVTGPVLTSNSLPGFELDLERLRALVSASPRRLRSSRRR